MPKRNLTGNIIDDYCGSEADISLYSKGRKHQARSGLYTAQNPLKYIGNPRNIVFRSSWELKMMHHLDLNPAVIRWGSEEFSIRYYDPVRKRARRYFPDMFVEMRQADGKILKMLIEIKPHEETRPPEKKLTGKKQQPTKRYIQEALTYETNNAKWNAAIEFCNQHSMTFKIFTEYELGLKRRR